MMPPIPSPRRASETVVEREIGRKSTELEGPCSGVESAPRPWISLRNDPEALRDHLVHDLVGARADALQASVPERAAHS